MALCRAGLAAVVSRLQTVSSLLLKLNPVCPLNEFGVVTVSSVCLCSAAVVAGSCGHN